MAGKGQGPILIAGQTASGKSALALKLATEHDGIIINADSMQVYDTLQILTARPRQEEMAPIPHELYGHVSPRTAYSVGHWIEDIKKTLDKVAQRGKRPIIVGGTGLYFKALLEGLSPVPEIPDEIRKECRRMAEEPDRDLLEDLRSCDPAMAAMLNAGDRQRITRAIEVFKATGKSLLDWQGKPDGGLLDESTTERYVISIDRALLYQRCNQRFDEMMDRGALEEVSSLLALQLPSSLPAMRALGVRPLSLFLSGDLTLEDALEKAKTETRQYAKRQGTWLRSNMITWNHVNTQ